MIKLWSKFLKNKEIYAKATSTISIFRQPIKIPRLSKTDQVIIIRKLNYKIEKFFDNFKQVFFKFSYYVINSLCWWSISFEIFTDSWQVFNEIENHFFKRGLHCQIYSTFLPHFMCWKYFDEYFMDENLLCISLTEFNKPNNRRKHTFLRTQFCFIFSFHFQHIFSLSLVGRLIYTCFRKIFLTRVE